MNRAYVTTQVDRRDDVRRDGGEEDKGRVSVRGDVDNLQPEEVFKLGGACVDEAVACEIREEFSIRG